MSGELTENDRKFIEYSADRVKKYCNEHETCIDCKFDCCGTCEVGYPHQWGTER